jgi:hypothetical protein
MLDPSDDDLFLEEQQSRVMARYGDLGIDIQLASSTHPAWKVP